MAIQRSVAVRDASNNTFESTVGTAPLLRLRSGSQPANCAAARTGTVLATITLPSDWLAASSSGTVSKSGTWSGTGAAAAGTGTTAGHYEIMDSGGTTCHEQGSVGVSFTLTTSALTAANENVLTFASTTGVAVGQKVSGTGILTNATVIAVGAGLVALSLSSTAGVSSGATITFGYDLNLDNASIASGQAVTVSTYSFTAGNA